MRDFGSQFAGGAGNEQGKNGERELRHLHHACIIETCSSDDKPQEGC
jgi:hypothetical protein